MNRVTVKDTQGNILQQVIFEDEIIQAEWIQMLAHTSAWGKAEHEICTKEQVLDEEMEVLEEAEYETIPSEYIVEIQDCSSEIDQIKINIESEEYLKSTDFYVIRMMDSGVPMPEGMQLLRQQARDRIVRT